MLLSSLRSSGPHHSRDSSVHNKISQFNSLTVQSKHLERKTADAALKRAMLGREEAESEMRRYRDEAKALRKQIDEGRERERKVGERLETVMVGLAPNEAKSPLDAVLTRTRLSPLQENYGRAKETHAHTQALWEKEIRRARKETFKSQSVIVKLQEELKSARTSLKSTEETLEQEKERSRAREHEAFQTRYELVGCQEQLDLALEQAKLLEQERDAFRSLAKSDEDIAKMAADGMLPLPKPEHRPEDGGEEDEFASPRKRQPRVSSLSIADVTSSAASEAEIQELTRLWHWERRRADRAAEQIDFLETECELRACPCMKMRPRTSIVVMESVARKRPAPQALDGCEDGKASTAINGTTAVKTKAPTLSPRKQQLQLRMNAERRKEGPRRSTIFVPEEGVFRTVSQEEAEALEAASIPAPDSSIAGSPPASAHPDSGGDDAPFFSRTPSVEPPAFAMPAQRASLISLLEAPHKGAGELLLNFHVPTTPAGPPPPQTPTLPAIQPANTAEEEAQDVAGVTVEEEEEEKEQEEEEEREEVLVLVVEEETQETAMTLVAANELEDSSNSQSVDDERPEEEAVDEEEGQEPTPRPHTAAAFYSIKTTTTKVPLREASAEITLAKRILEAQNQPQRTPSYKTTHQHHHHGAPSFDTSNPALTPTMTREQALAQIRERRGRARSAASGAVTPRRQMVEGKERRDVSAPMVVGRAGSVKRIRS